MLLKRLYRYDRTYTIEEAAREAFTDDADSGVAENAAAHARHLTDRMAALVAVLHRKGVLFDDDVLDLLGYGFKKAGT